MCCVCAERSRSLTLRSVMPEKTAETPAAVPSPAATPLDSPGSGGAGSSGGASDDATSDGTPQQKGGGKSSAGSSLVRAAAIWPWADTLPALSLLCADRRLWRSLPALFAGPFPPLPAWCSLRCWNDCSCGGRKRQRRTCGGTPLPSGASTSDWRITTGILTTQWRLKEERTGLDRNSGSLCDT